MAHFNVSETVARLEREANVAAGLSDEPLEPIPDFRAADQPGYATVAEATAALRESLAPTDYKAHQIWNGFNVRPSDMCKAPSAWGTNCGLREFHAGRHDWQVDGEIASEPAMLPGMPEPGPTKVSEYDPNFVEYDDGWFEISADIKAVRGKNTSNGPALEIVLDASIDGHVAEVMGLIGRGFTRILFKPYVVQQKLPLTQEVTPLTYENDSEPAEAGQEHDDDDETGDD